MALAAQWGTNIELLLWTYFVLIACKNQSQFFIVGQVWSRLTYNTIKHSKNLFYLWILQLTLKFGQKDFHSWDCR